MANDITSANSSFVINIPEVFVVPQILQQYATDDAFMTDEVDVAETQIGVDGVMSAGYLPHITAQTITFQANSPSITQTFEAWAQANQAAQTPYFASNATILLPSLGKQYTLSNGVLKRITPIPAAKKILQPVKYQIHWNNWSASPFSI